MLELNDILMMWTYNLLREYLKFFSIPANQCQQNNIKSSTVKPLSIIPICIVFPHYFTYYHLYKSDIFMTFLQLPLSCIYHVILMVSSGTVDRGFHCIQMWDLGFSKQWMWSDMVWSGRNFLHLHKCVASIFRIKQITQHHIWKKELHFWVYKYHKIKT